MRFEAKDYIKAAVFAVSMLVYYFTVSKDIEIRIVKLEVANENNARILKEIREDVKFLINKRVR